MRKERYTIMILDDELESTGLLQYALSKIDYVEVLHLIDSPEHALKVLDLQPVDILIVDMEMPTMMGWEFVGLLDKRPTILVATGHREYGFEAEEMEAVGYLPKLVKSETLRKAIDKAIRDVDHRYDLAQKNAKAIKVKNYETKMDDIISLDDLYYAEVEDKILSLFLDDGRIIYSKMPLSKLMEDLPDNKFVRLSAKHIVGRHAVKSLAKKKVQVREWKKTLEIIYPTAYEKLQLILDPM